MHINFLKIFKINYDCPEPWGIFFQDNATPQMEALEELHNNIMFYLAVIMFAVT
jgi:cytochrome c oxidase subunit 2